MIWAQDDIEAYEMGDRQAPERLLIASSQSELGQALHLELGERLRAYPAHVRFVGLEALENETAADYDAVVILNSCIAWGVDRNVGAFLDREREQEKLIVLTTSGDGDWRPGGEAREFEAVTSASEISEIERVAGEILGHLDAILSAGAE
ncbi:MAG: hypothetical protein GF330_02390 [Candidatus Eisenbacteria bacterium]|nr:hypothetical protein [Candidatus Eisenbacteria bacterium]